jgi:hypothetical protein
MPLSQDFRQMDYFALVYPEKARQMHVQGSQTPNLAMRCWDVGRGVKVQASDLDVAISVTQGRSASPRKATVRTVGPEMFLMAQEVRPENDIMFNLMFVLFPFV